MSPDLYSPTHGDNFGAKLLIVENTGRPLSSSLSHMPATLPLSKIMLFAKAALNITHAKFFHGLCVSGFSIFHKWLKILTCTGVGIHMVILPWNLSLFLFLEHWAPGIGMIQTFLCLCIFTLRKPCYTPRNIIQKHFLLISFCMKLLLALARKFCEVVTTIIFQNNISVQSTYDDIKTHSFQIKIYN